ncbi:hypothetical protein EKK97_06505 [Billgrantia tianxiuensis]|jgi:ABC-type amino acid transport system permease subunit|uniref:DUF1453 domain-containing protein n=2 Tax=Halomonadaceae TaxID=28256 RepID=A0A6I6SL60_9GAMM|nr:MULTISPECIES: DUF6622 family protein [Halomonas]MCE8032768.1 hypothetical protein [Halomonas sp. MCCC 1A11057]QHC49336.1 hypothetical protein EKK97_06505 [Halomonas tianxiuensis]
MLIEIIRNTPRWVFLLFIVLLVMGYQQSRDRTASRRNITILPAVFLALALYGVVSAFGADPVGLALWALGVTLSVALHIKLAIPRGVCFSPEHQTFHLPGSWQPLVIMLAIFFSKYTVEVIRARQLPVADTVMFTATVSLLYGLFSGVFLGRALVMWRVSQLGRSERMKELR